MDRNLCLRFCLRDSLFALWQQRLHLRCEILHFFRASSRTGPLCLRAFAFPFGAARRNISGRTLPVRSTERYGVLHLSNRCLYLYQHHITHCLNESINMKRFYPVHPLYVFITFPLLFIKAIISRTGFQGTRTVAYIAKAHEAVTSWAAERMIRLVYTPITLPQNSQLPSAAGTTTAPQYGHFTLALGAFAATTASRSASRICMSVDLISSAFACASL